MNRKLLHIILSAAVFGLGCSAAAQVSSKAVVKAGYLYENVVSRNLWLGSDNVAGIRCDSLNISDVAFGGNFLKGNLSGEAPMSWKAGAKARSITHLKNFSMVGSFSFDQRMTYDDCGSMFLRPGLYPVDVIEYTPGRKSLQTYSFTGGIAVPVARNWTVGVELDFSSSNYSKLKDLRYTDYVLDLSLRPGFVWKSDDGVSVGASLRLDRNTETVDPEQIGATANSYLAFLDKGLHYGLLRAWGNEAVHLDDNGINGFPVRCVCYGASVQAGGSGWLGELSYLYTDGKIGEKDAMWYKFPQHKVSVMLGKTFVSGDGVENTFKLLGSFERVNLFEAVMEKTTEGGVTIRETYGYNSIFNRSRLSVSPSWYGCLPGKFDASASLTYSREDGIVSIKYPVLCGRTLQRISFDASARTVLPCGFSIPMSVSAGTGFLGELNRFAMDGAGTVGIDDLPEHEDAAYAAWKTCNTAFDFSAAAALRYTFKPQIYIEAGGSFRILQKMMRGGANLSVGYVF